MYLFLGCCALITLSGLTFRYSEVAFPGLSWPVSVSGLVLLAGSFLVLLPLGNPWGSLEGSLVRERSERLVTVSVATGLAVVTCQATIAASTTYFSPEFGLLLIGASLVLNVIFGSMAWLPALLVGFGALSLEYSKGGLVSLTTARLGIVPFATVLVVAMGVWVLRRPRARSH